MDPSEFDIFRIPLKSTEDIEKAVFLLPLRTDETESATFLLPRIGAGENWEYYGTEVFEPITQAKADWNEDDGNYGGYGGRIQIEGGYKFVMIVPVGSYWGDCTFDPVTCPQPYRGTLGFKTQGTFDKIGPGGTMEASETRYANMADAVDAWINADPLVLPLGSDGYLIWGFQDNFPSNNIGSLLFMVYIKK